ncbi:hypothetical protein ACIBD9_09255 [Micromonospora sp. NPDC050784]
MDATESALPSVALIGGRQESKVCWWLPLELICRRLDLLGFAEIAVSGRG